MDGSTSTGGALGATMRPRLLLAGGLALVAAVVAAAAFAFL